jgi:hypothetical protein
MVQGFLAGGIVDFWVSPVGWALELLRDGIDMREHEQRFEPGGKYHNMPMGSYAVLDFRSQPAARPQLRQAASSYHFIFTNDYSRVSMVKADSHERWELTLAP